MMVTLDYFLHAVAAKRQTWNDANAKAEKQEVLTQSAIQMSIPTIEAKALFARAKKDAERRVVTPKAECESISLEGRGQSDRVSLVGNAEAEVLKYWSSAEPAVNLWLGSGESSC